VQRIPQYVLMLNEMLSHTKAPHFDHENIQAALQNMKLLGDYINARKHDADEINKILEIQNKIVNWPSSTQLVRPRRKILKEGILLKDNDKMQTFLFNDALLYCTTKQKNKLKFKGFILLSTSSFNSKVKGCDFEIVSATGKFHFSALQEEKDIWIKAVHDAIQDAQKDLLSSAFEGVEKKESEGSVQFQEMIKEETTRKRSEIASRIVADEKQYTDSLEYVVEKLINPLRSAVDGKNLILSVDEIDSVFSNFFWIYNAHSRFLERLEHRVRTWDSESGKLGDLFNEHVDAILKLYATYTDSRPKSQSSSDRCFNANLIWAAFIVQHEKDNKISLKELLDKPLKRLPQYYLLIQEMLSYTVPANPDYNLLKSVTSKLSSQTLQHQQKIEDKTASSKRLTLSSRKSSFHN